MDMQEIKNLVTTMDKAWERIESIKHSDPFQAQVLYEKYKTMGKELEAELPPPLESVVMEDQAVS